jgi:class 3 adenylate cyclase/pimeloyl-ACP methyl ester carboxylesterase
VDLTEPRFTKTADGTHIAYLVMGDGPVDLVYAFGYLSNIDSDGDVPFHAAFRQRLASFSRLILFDRRGTGLSDREALADANALEAGMDDIRAVMDAVGSERALLFGLADGAMLTCLFAASHPDRTTGLVLWAPYARGRWAPDYPHGQRDEVWDSYIDDMERNWGSMDFVRRNLSDVAPDTAFSPEVLQRAARMFRAAASPGSAAAIERTRRDSDVRSVFEAVQVPTLAMHSSGADYLEEARFSASLIPGASFVEIPGRDYLPFWGAAERVEGEISGFIEKVRHEEAELSRALATVLFTDIVGSTERAAELGDRGWKELLERHHAIVRAMLRRYRGTEVDTAGDGFFATFDGPARGIRCAQTIGEAVRSIGIESRAGLHTGEVETIAGKIGGIAVHIGARVGALASANEILVSSTVRDLVVGSGLAFESIGEHELKGVPDRWHLYRVAE